MRCLSIYVNNRAIHADIDLYDNFVADGFLAL